MNTKRTIVIEVHNHNGKPLKRTYRNVRVYGGEALNHNAKLANTFLVNTFNFGIGAGLLLAAIYGGTFETETAHNGKGKVTVYVQN